MQERLMELIENFNHSPEHVSRADIDELIMTIEVLESDLPKRFLEVAISLDKTFNSTSPQHSRGAYERLIRILNVFASLPKRTIQTPTEHLLPTFTLETKDKTHVLKLCAKMRMIVLATEVFDQPHKRRLLNRIAGIEYQVEQPKGLLDVVRGGVSDVGETLGKFGTDIKPLTDRMKEVMQITRKNSKEYDQIPAPEEIKQIEDQRKEDEE